jgi:2-hydroxychromene-2-carboxylate isomerase
LHLLEPTFYYDFNSPYAYLAAQRVEGIVGAVRWQPIAFAFVLRATGRTPWSLTEARDGVVGVPTVVIDGEPFWGDDRLEAAAAQLAA